jgi:hypothetical protein
VHGDVVLAGPIWWTAVALFLVTWALAAFVAFDSLRSVRSVRFEQLPEPRWLYFVPSVVFFLAAAISQFAGVGTLAVAVIAGAPVVLVLSMVYLFRIVFPKQVAGS